MIEIQDWGLIDYKSAWDKQKELVNIVQKERMPGFLVMCEHPPVITIGKSGTKDNILFKPEFLESVGVQVIENDRGGDVTLHNPGQLVGYPIFNLSAFREDLHWFLREIEESIIELISSYGLAGGRVSGLTGVWIDSARKIAAMGLHCSRWVTSHGFALNANNDLSQFNYIVPCGIVDKGVCSIKSETGVIVDFDELKLRCADIFLSKFA